MSNFSMADYVPVNERIEQFYQSFPEGSIQAEIVELTEARVTVKAYAFRKPDDPRPGIGHSSLSIPGSTPYTRGSEIENAETSAWGRAIAALGFEVKRGIASAEEVRNKSTETSQAAQPATRPARESGGPSPAGIPAPAAYDEDPGFAPIDPQTGEPILLQEVAQRTGGTVVPEKPEYVRRAEAQAAKIAEWVCPVHGTSKVVPAGVSKKTGKPYNAFTACGEQGCNEKPGRRAA